VIYPQGIWGLFARSWELSLRADNKMLKRRGELAGVPNLHAHRFRHTLAHA
jgi:integrase